MNSLSALMFAVSPSFNVSALLGDGLGEGLATVGVGDAFVTVGFPEPSSSDEQPDTASSRTTESRVVVWRIVPPEFKVQDGIMRASAQRVKTMCPSCDMRRRP
ncbi:hypothetical protein SGFS_065630 [Streptomyces graminofaciens]|uniref:Secreted protein n=1 Tax=Streptomyces graminofaciens TaxID=68212 RepID=A0ABM7FGW2_9ACTN|nr:hypothetical protein SGFS_065630 [Streptomyces graminofaciens]